MEQANKYNLKLYLGFINFKKAFDSIYHNNIGTALERRGVNKGYIKIIENMYIDNKGYVETERRGKIFPIRKGVRQGDSSSPNIFIAELEKIFKTFDWEDMGISNMAVNGMKLSTLKFADDVVLIASSGEELVIMIS